MASGAFSTAASGETESTPIPPQSEGPENRYARWAGLELGGWLFLGGTVQVKHVDREAKRYRVHGNALLWCSALLSIVALSDVPSKVLPTLMAVNVIIRLIWYRSSKKLDIK